MTVNVNGYEWKIIYTHNKKDLSRSDGSLTLGVTDLNVMSIFLYDKLVGDLKRKVLIHELVHAWIFSYGIIVPLEWEEFMCSFIDSYGLDIINTADYLLCSGYCNIAL